MGKFTKGFIVHPNWTGDDRYHSATKKSKTKSLDTLAQAKVHAKTQGYKTALYKTSSGNVQEIQLKPTKKRRRPRNNLFDNFRLF